MTSTRTRLVASLTPLLLTAPVAFTATPATATPAPERQVAAAGDPAVSLSTFRFQDVVMNRNRFDGNFYFAELRGAIKANFGPGVDWQGTAFNPVTVSLRINGRPAAPPFNFIGFNFTNGARTAIGALAPNNLGAGRWTVGPVSLAITDNGVDRSAMLGNTDTFYVRRPSLTSIGARRHGNLVTLTIRAQVRDARTWKPKSAHKALVERKVRGGWKLVRKVRVNSAGKGSLRLRSPRGTPTGSGSSRPRRPQAAPPSPAAAPEASTPATSACVARPHWQVWGDGRTHTHRGCHASGRSRETTCQGDRG